MNLDTVGKQEQIAPASGVYQKDGKWLMRFDDKSDGAEIPPDIARVISTALRFETHKQRIPGGIGRTHRDINCHKAAFYTIGLTSSPHKGFGGHFYKFFPDSSFHAFNSNTDVEAYIRGTIAKDVGLVQIVNRHEKMRLGHSFIAAVDDLGRVVCFDKQGSSRPFRIVSLETMCKSYQFTEAGWAARSVDTIGSDEIHALQEYIKKTEDEFDQLIKRSLSQG